MRVLVLLLLLVRVAYGDTVPHAIQVFSKRGGKISVRLLDSERLSRSWTSVRSNPPHRQLNPEHRTFVFEGVELLRLLRGVDLDRAKYVYAVGSDSYVSMIPSAIVRDHKVILAFRQDGVPLIRGMGEQQIIFPTEPGDIAPVPSAIAQKAAFWNWYVRGIVVGELPSRFVIEDRQVPIRVDVDPGKLVDYVPPSTFSYKKQTCPRVAEIPLSNLRAPKEATAAKTLSGESYVVTTFAGYRLLASAERNAIPVECGGPFILVKSSKSPTYGRYRPDDLIYLVYGIGRPGWP